MDFSDYRVTAHRGLYDPGEDVPENSLAAFENALRRRVAVELDVRLTKDGKAVVFHDDGLMRMTGDPRLVADCTYDELRRLRLSGTSQSIPLFSEVLDLVDGGIPLLIELKEDRFQPQVAEKALSLLSGYSGGYLMESFNPYLLLWLRRHAPETVRGQLSGRDFPTLRSRTEKLALRRMVFNGLTRPGFVAYDISYLTPALAHKLRKKGLAVFGWTARDPRELVKAARLCDCVIFERLPLSQARRVLESGRPKP